MKKMSKSTDASNGWEQLGDAFVAQARASTVGVRALEKWCRTVPRGAALADVGCGPGGPRADVFAARGLHLYGIDSAPTLLAAYAQRYPSAQTLCESAEETSFFHQTFDAVVAWGLVFLLSPSTQAAVLSKSAGALRIGGRLLFTAPPLACGWRDLSTGRPSQSLGAPAYRRKLRQLGLTVYAEFEDEGHNYYFDAVRKR
jgi:SAM-dependent methyltransferase